MLLNLEDAVMNITSLYGLKGNEMWILDRSINNKMCIIFFEEISNKQEISLSVPLADTLLLTVEDVSIFGCDGPFDLTLVEGMIP